MAKFSIKSDLEKVFIGLVFFSLMVNYLIEVKGAFLLVYIFLILLLFYYIIKIKEWVYQLVMSGMIIDIIGRIARFMHWSGASLMLLAGTAAYFIFGILMIRKALQESWRNSNFELLGFLLGIFLFVPSVVFFISEAEGVLQFYSFAFAFIIGTIMYNDNLWEKYSTGEKKVITYLLVSALVNVINMSLKLM